MESNKLWRGRRGQRRLKKMNLYFDTFSKPLWQLKGEPIHAEFFWQAFVCRFGETLKTVIHKVAAAATKENLLARIQEILGSHRNIDRIWGSLFLDSNCALSLCFNYREVVQQLIEEYQAATRADYIMWGTQQQVS